MGGMNVPVRGGVRVARDRHVRRVACRCQCCQAALTHDNQPANGRPDGGMPVKSLERSTSLT